MKASSEREAIDTALKRAAKDAISGSREQRSGRLLTAADAKRRAASVLSQDDKKRR